jgi:hypothetical protein
VLFKGHGGRRFVNSGDYEGTTILMSENVNQLGRSEVQSRCRLM